MGLKEFFSKGFFYVPFNKQVTFCNYKVLFYVIEAREILFFNIEGKLLI